MDVREKLVELILNADNDKNLGSYDLYELTHERTGLAEYFADYLISNGVTVQDVPDINVGNKWISVKDKLPNDREWVLVWHTGYSTPKKAKHKDDCDPYLPIFILDGDKGLGGEVTHWMPLPKPPKGE